MATGRLVIDLPDGGTGIKRVEPNATMAIWWSKARMGQKKPPRDAGDVSPLSVPGSRQGRNQWACCRLPRESII